MTMRREYFVMPDRGRFTVAYRNTIEGDTRPGNADNLPEFAAMPGVRFLTEGKAGRAAASLQAAYAAGLEEGKSVATAR